MLAERDSDLRELHENLDELLKDFTGLGLDSSPLPAFSPDMSGHSSPSFHGDAPHFGVRTKEQTVQTQANFSDFHRFSAVLERREALWPGPGHGTPL